MSISYDKLWKLLIDAKMNRTELKNAAGISSNIVVCFPCLSIFDDYLDGNLLPEVGENPVRPTHTI